MASYLELKIEEALKKSRGNQTKARSLVSEMVEEDERLLRALAKPHLTAIIAHAVNRGAIATKKPKKQTDELPQIPKGSKAQAGFGLDLLKALGGQNVPKFGVENQAPPVAKKAASKQHVDALKMMAAKSKTKI